MEQQIKPIKRPHPHQLRDIETIFDKIRTSPPNARLLYQLPTGGGKTLVFSEIARRFLEAVPGKVIVLTHRVELCRQTALVMKKMGIRTGELMRCGKLDFAHSDCVVAMVETLRNRIRDKQIPIADVRLVIIDEAHHNAFRKLLKKFRNAVVLGVTATPFSSDLAAPMNKTYAQLITGADISSLIAGGFLARPQSVVQKVELNTLKTGIHGDYTVASSNELYGTPAMQELLLTAYRENCAGKKTLIFNNGIDTSVRVCETFTQAGIAIRHLDNKTDDATRKEILIWFRKTKGAVLTSVSILTTGFDEPTVQAVMLNRATTSITLYHQMIGRGSRILPSKKTFRIIDLGNNIDRFGPWEQPLDWADIFAHPDRFAQQLSISGSAAMGATSHAITAEMRAKFPNTLEMGFDIEAHYQDIIDSGLKPKSVIQQSLRQHALMCIENADTLSGALTLAEVLLPEIDWRVKQYTSCIGKATKNYREWLFEDYNKRLARYVQKIHHIRAHREPLAKTA